jgi:hypothetical protein
VNYIIFLKKCVTNFRKENRNLSCNNLLKMKVRIVLLFAIFCFSFRPSIQKTSSVASASNGFYILVDDFTDRTKHSYIVQSRDSVDVIFKLFFESELELGDVNRPITIFNGEHDFYVARVSVFQKTDGKLSFHHLKYPKIKVTKRARLAPVTL